jgi:hypothetical protein
MAVVLAPATGPTPADGLLTITTGAGFFFINMLAVACNQSR